MRSTGLGVVASDDFQVDGPAQEAVRVCLSGPTHRDKLKAALEFMGHAHQGAPEMSGSFF